MFVQKSAMKLKKDNKCDVCLWVSFIEYPFDLYKSQKYDICPFFDDMKFWAMWKREQKEYNVQSFTKARTHVYTHTLFLKDESISINRDTHKYIFGYRIVSSLFAIPTYKWAEYGNSWRWYLLFTSLIREFLLSFNDSFNTFHFKVSNCIFFAF